MQPSQLEVNKRIRQSINEGGSILALNGLRLKSLPESIRELTHLKTLSLNDNQFSEIPKEIFALTELENLYLARNRISKLNASIDKLFFFKKLGFERQLSSSDSRRHRGFKKFKNSVSVGKSDYKSA